MVAERGLPGDSESFGRLIETYRRDVTVLCYRFLGSLNEAEEAAQETAIRAWRSRDAFRGDASPRTWLHRIATRVCLDLLDRRRRRPVLVELAPSSDPGMPPAAGLADVAWAEPLPDAWLADVASDPAARYTLRESVSLAFVAAIQALPPRQLAVLILRDVIGWSASEVAVVLEMSVGAVNSALHRARTALESRRGSDSADVAELPPADAEVRRLVEAYVAAWEADDIAGLVALLSRDVRLAMPPSPSWYAGPEAVGAFIGGFVFAAGPRGRFRMSITGANGQPAVTLSERQPDGTWVATSIQVLTVRADGIRAIVASMDPAIVARFADSTGGTA
jgi:RNA polymerase sigma-70 factor, ECF subfamily